MDAVSELTIPFEIILSADKATERNGDWIVEGFAATSDTDLVGDTILPEAFSYAAEELAGLTVLHNHDPNQEIGTVVKGKAKSDKLWVQCRISKQEEKLWEKIKEGVLNKFSIRGKIEDAVKRWSAKLKRTVNVIRRLHIVEVSLVAVPANPEARAVRWYVASALHQYEVLGGIVPLEEEGSMEVEKVFEEFCKFLAERTKESNYEDCSDEDVEKAWDEWTQKEKYPYPQPYPYPKPAAVGKAVVQRKKLVADIRAALKKEKPDVMAALKALDALEKMVGPSPVPAAKKAVEGTEAVSKSVPVPSEVVPEISSLKELKDQMIGLQTSLKALEELVKSSLKKGTSEAVPPKSKAEENKESTYTQGEVVEALKKAGLELMAGKGGK